MWCFWFEPRWFWWPIMMGETMPEREVVQLPPPKNLAPVNHPLGEAVTVKAEVSISGFEQREKTCRNCGAVRVTVLGVPVEQMRAWRRGAQGPQFATSVEPPCDKDARWFP